MSTAVHQYAVFQEYQSVRHFQHNIPMVHKLLGMVYAQDAQDALRLGVRTYRLDMLLLGVSLVQSNVTKPVEPGKE